jgi:hypothetical protein
MSKVLKRILYIVVGVIGIIILYFGISTLVFFNSAKDKSNVIIEGFVIDKKTKSPIQNATGIIYNSTYKSKGDDYTDYSSYLGYDSLYISADDRGYYSITLDKSSFVEIKFGKDGYTPNDPIGFKVKKRNNQNIFLLSN